MCFSTVTSPLSPRMTSGFKQPQSSQLLDMLCTLSLAGAGMARSWDGASSHPLASTPGPAAALHPPRRAETLAGLREQPPCTSQAMPRQWG